MANTHILFLTLRVFSATGGIEKVCRVAGKALHELSIEGGNKMLRIFSLYDATANINTSYFPVNIFKGFGKRRLNFLHSAFKAGISSHIVILSHVNLLPVGYIIKLFSPGTKLMLIAHGIEVWHSFPWWKKKMLRQCNLVLPVSDFTKRTMVKEYQLPEEKMMVINNCLDPFLQAPKPQQLLDRYGINTGDIVLLTLTRLASTEKYKGYDLVMQAIHDLKEKLPSLKYLIVGKYDAPEKERLDKMIAGLGLQQQIILTGFIPDEALAGHYDLADLFIMPSRKEGFGIVFIEAMYYGKPAIAGNMDGSVDALHNGEFGLLINPNSQQEITDAIVEVISNYKKYVPEHAAVMKYFGFEVYKEKLKKIIGLDYLSQEQ